VTAWRRAAGDPICARSQVCQKRRRKLDDQAFPRTKWSRCADHVGPADGGSALPTCWPTHSPDPAQSCGRMCSTFLSTCDRTGSGRLSRQGGRAPLPAASDPPPIRVPDAGLSRRSGVSKRRCTRPNGDGETLDPPQDSSASCYSSLHFGRFEWQVEPKSDFVLFRCGLTPRQAIERRWPRPSSCCEHGISDDFIALSCGDPAGRDDPTSPLVATIE
jgi:hypothetical protein